MADGGCGPNRTAMSMPWATRFASVWTLRPRSAKAPCVPLLEFLWQTWRKDVTRMKKTYSDLLLRCLWPRMPNAPRCSPLPQSPQGAEPHVRSAVRPPPLAVGTESCAVEEAHTHALLKLWKLPGLHA